MFSLLTNCRWVPCNNIVTVRSPGGSLVLAVPLYALPYAAFDLKSKPMLIHFLSILCSVILQTHNYPAKENAQYYHHCCKFVNFEHDVVSTRSSFLRKNYKLTKSQIISFGNKSFGCLKNPFTKPIYQAMKFCRVHKHVFHSFVKYDVAPIQLCIAMSGYLRAA